MEGEVRERLILPLVIPLGALALIGVLVFSFSRVLLAAPREVAVAVALMLALNILAVCAVLAGRPRGMRFNPLLIAAVALAPLVLGVASTGVATKSKEGTPSTAKFRTVELGAKNTAFDKKQLTVVAGERYVIKFNNQDAVSHNLAIFAGSDAGGQKLFAGEIFAGPKTMDYRIPSLAAGSYFFRCDVHPAIMTGTIVAEEKKSKAKPGPARASVSAVKLAFSKPELSFRANSEVDLEFDNEESVPHNVAIFRGTDDKGDKVFSGEVITGPKKVVYRVPALVPGIYYFHCDIHPRTMKGSIKVA